MTDRDRNSGLVGRIQQVRRLAAVRDHPTGSHDAVQPEPVREPPDDRMRALETRVAHLEQLVEGLQDSVHRESERHDRQIAELQAQVEPGAMGAALADDARNRGL